MTRGAAAIAAAALALVVACSERDRSAAAPPSPPATPRSTAPPSPPATPAPRPPPAVTPAAAPRYCADQLAGRWVGRRHAAGRWHEQRLSLERVGQSYVCRREIRSWPGPRSARLPPSCPRGGRAYSVTRLPCALRVTGPYLSVTAGQVDQQVASCGGPVTDEHLAKLSGVAQDNAWAAEQFEGGRGPITRYAMYRVACAP
ncbi:MAG: hypothetical protein R3B06_00135 [Kofleriaceae bacterium]